MRREPTAIFFFAHQDDEFGVFHQLCQERQAGRRICCVYLTDGASNGVTAQTRNAESVAVLLKLGVAERDIVFAGHELSIGDGTLADNMDTARGWLVTWMEAWIDAGTAEFSDVAAVYVPAWEGGHPDHDAAHAVVAGVMASMNLLHKTMQFSLYNGYQCPAPFFRVLSPLLANGKVVESRIPFVDRLRFLALCLAYPSQAKTWIGLFPFVLWNYLVTGTQYLQPISLEQLQSRPHAGTLYYEARKFYDWPRFAARLQAHWRKSG